MGSGTLGRMSSAVLEPFADHRGPLTVEDDFLVLDDTIEQADFTQPVPGELVGFLVGATATALLHSLIEHGDDGVAPILKDALSGNHLCGLLCPLMEARINLHIIPMLIEELGDVAYDLGIEWIVKHFGVLFF